MLFTRLDLLTRLTSAGVPLWTPHLSGDVFSSVSRPWVDAVWMAGIRELQLNAPELVEVRDLGAGRSLLVPRYVINGFNCRGHSQFIYSRGLIGFAIQGSFAAGRPGMELDHDALAWGVLEYTAEPRPENLHRDGRHESLWFMDHEGEFQTFEGGDGDEHEFTRTELASITFLHAQ